MVDRKEQIKQWQNRLCETFISRADTNGSYYKLLYNEVKTNLFIKEKYSGFLDLVLSFSLFLGDTLEYFDSKKYHLFPSQFPKNYSVLILYFIKFFQDYRAANNLFEIGYPHSGISILRNIKDKSMALAAVGNGYSSFSKLIGLPDQANEGKLGINDYKAFRKKRKQEELRVQELLTRSKSNLTESTLKDLDLLEKMYNEEVHTNLTFVAHSGIPWMMSTKGIPIVPNPSDEICAFYGARSYEVGWMLLKLLPLLQIQGFKFSQDWVVKWHVLDVSFEFIVTSVDIDGKSIGQSFLEFVNKKMAFSPEETIFTDDMG